MRWAAALLWLALLPLLSDPAIAAIAPDLSGFAYRQQPGAQLPLESIFQDLNARSTRLGDAFGGRPTILALGYFHCPNLCGVARADLYNALDGTDMVAGRDYTLIALSIDPTEGSADARAAKARDASAFPLPGAEAGWRFLTGRADAIEGIKRAVGFRDTFDPKQKQFVHPAGLVFLTPQGVVSGYLLGVGYSSADVRLGVMRAGRGGVQKAAFPILLLCFHYDAATGRYTLAIMRLLQLAGGVTALTIGGTLYLAFRRDRTSS